jgi:NAD(P)-dependent dehydrogenase (short-subunit alcohol dehydrogenase family)
VNLKCFSNRITRRNNVNFQLTHLLLDVLKSSAPSRIVYLMNLDYRKGSIKFDDLNFTETYNQSQAFYQSQLANMTVVKELARELRDSTVTVNAAYPGEKNDTF